MGIVERYMEYAAAFEEAYASDDWSKLEPFFTDDAVYEFIALRHSAASMKDERLSSRIKNSVNGLDRRFDSRAVEVLQGPTEKDGGVWIRWAAIYTLAGYAGLPPGRRRTRGVCRKTVFVALQTA